MKRVSVILTLCAGIFLAQPAYGQSLQILEEKAYEITVSDCKDMGITDSQILPQCSSSVLRLKKNLLKYKIAWEEHDRFLKNMMEQPRPAHVSPREEVENGADAYAKFQANLFLVEENQDKLNVMMEDIIKDARETCAADADTCMIEVFEEIADQIEYEAAQKALEDYNNYRKK